MGLLVLAPNAAAAPRVAVRVVPLFSPKLYATRGAVGSLVPASGSTVSRATALASLTRGKLENALLGGKPQGKPLISLGGPKAPVTIYVALPPPGKHHNLDRYPIAIVGDGYRGLLLSSSTHVPGLVSIADVAPTVRSLERGEKPLLTSQPARDAPAELETMNARLDAAHFARKTSTRVLIGLVFGFAALAWLLRSPLFGRASLLAIPAMVLASTIASALHVEHGIAWWSGAIALALALPLAFATRTPRRLAVALAALLVAYAGFLGVSRSTVSLAALGPHPEGGGRYFGLTNQVETLLLAPTLALLGLRGRVTVARAALAAAGVIALGLALVGIDALTGGSSHVTHAVGGGPGRVLSDLGHRLHLSWRGIVNKTDHLEIAIVSLVTLVVLSLLRPRSRTLDALLVALAVSLAVNDSGFDILRFGALVAIAVFTWSRTMRLRD